MSTGEPINPFLRQVTDPTPFEKIAAVQAGVGELATQFASAMIEQQMPVSYVETGREMLEREGGLKLSKTVLPH